MARVSTFFALLISLSISVAPAVARQSHDAKAEELLDKARLLVKERRLDDAIAAIDEAIRIAPALPKAYTAKWHAMLKRADWESEVPKIRAEVETLLARREKREAALEAAASGFEILGDTDGKRKADDLFIAEFPESNHAARILLDRALLETDKQKQADLIEAYAARYPDDPNNGTWLAKPFRFRAGSLTESNDKVVKAGEAWVRAATRVAHEMVVSRSSVAAVYAERRIELARALQIADEAVKIVEGFEASSPPLDKMKEDERAAFIVPLKERAHAARGFVLLRLGRLEEAEKEFAAALEPVIKEVEKRGFILWKDMDLVEIGLRPRVLWLAELYEARGEYERAAKYLLAGFGDDANANRYVRERLPVVFKRLGRDASLAALSLIDAEKRYRSLTDRTAAKDGERMRLLSSRLAVPAPDFQVTTLKKATIKLNDLRGKVVVLNFWATWCGPCVRELPHFEKAAEQYGENRNVVFLAISIDDNRPAVRPFIEKSGLKIVAAYDDDAADACKVKNIPATLFIDRDGVIRFREEGFGGEGSDYIERFAWRVDALLKEK